MHLHPTAAAATTATANIFGTPGEHDRVCVAAALCCLDDYDVAMPEPFAKLRGPREPHMLSYSWRKGPTRNRGSKWDGRDQIRC